MTKAELTEAASKFPRENYESHQRLQMMADFAASILEREGVYRENLVDALNEIHKVASAGCPVGESGEVTLERISEICAEVLK